MSKLCKYFLMMIMIIFIFVQVYFINKINNTKDVIVYDTQNRIDSHKTLTEINKELNCLKEKNILSAKKSNEKWIVDVKIQGSKEELLNEIGKLKNYDISDYIISRSEGENSLILEISEKEST